MSVDTVNDDDEEVPGLAETMARLAGIGAVIVIFLVAFGGIGPVPVVLQWVPGGIPAWGTGVTVHDDASPAVTGLYYGHRGGGSVPVLGIGLEHEEPLQMELLSARGDTLASRHVPPGMDRVRIDIRDHINITANNPYTLRVTTIHETMNGTAITLVTNSTESQVTFSITSSMN